MRTCTSAVGSLLLLLASCNGPLYAGPYIETHTWPPGTGHDWEGVTGLEIGRGNMAVAMGNYHPENGVDELVVRLVLRFPLFW